jgi:hypothetical protein
MIDEMIFGLALGAYPDVAAIQETTIVKCNCKIQRLNTDPNAVNAKLLHSDEHFT